MGKYKYLIPALGFVLFIIDIALLDTNDLETYLVEGFWQCLFISYIMFVHIPTFYLMLVFIIFITY